MTDKKQDSAQMDMDRRNRQRIADYESKLGRPLRVLHIGNVANNAYINAKIMRQFGIETDVLIFDYYHIMGCPEWEAGVVEKLVGSPDNPDWGATQVGDFKRPEWVVQGPAPLILRFLAAKIKNQTTKHRFYRWMIQKNLQLRGAESGPRRLLFLIATGAVKTAPRIKFVLLNCIRQLRHGVWRLGYGVRRLLHWGWILITVPWRGLHLGIRKTLVLLANMDLPEPLPRSRKKLKDWAKRVLEQHRDVETKSEIVPDTEQTMPPAIPADSPESGSTSSATRNIPLKAEDIAPEKQDVSQSIKAIPPETEAIRPTAYDLLPEKFRNHSARDDLLQYISRTKQMGPLFSHYDIVQGYSLDGVYSMLAEKLYVCYEHGTLRDIPFQDNTMGRICRVTYENANAVLITNTDCVAAADKLGIQKNRQYPVPHAFDSGRVLRFRKKNEPEFFPTSEPVTFIAPARHHWKNGDMLSWFKGNDISVRAARLLADEGLDFKIIFVNWGQEVHESRALIEELGVEQYFEWIDPVPKRRLWQYYMSCDGVLDQFVIPAIGGISFETLALGRPLFTRIDEKVFAQFFGSSPPLLNVHTPKGLAKAMARMIRDPAAYDDISGKALSWTAKHHSSERIIEIQLDAYDQVLTPAGFATTTATPI